MAVPKGFTVQCPGCDTYVEFDTCGWSLTMAEHPEKGVGLVIESHAWANHDCSGQ